MVKRLAQIDLGTEQPERAVVDFEIAHAAWPPSFGLKGAGVTRGAGLGFEGMKVHPDRSARRRASKIWIGCAAAGWTCRVAVVCMVLPQLCGGE